MQLLGCRELCRLGQTSKQFAVLCNDDVLWHFQCTALWDELAAPEESELELEGAIVRRWDLARDAPPPTDRPPLRTSSWKRLFSSKWSTELNWRHGRAARNSFVGSTMHVWQILLLPALGDRAPPLLVGACWDNTVRVWDFATSTQLHVMASHSAPITSLVHGAGPVVATSSNDRTVCVFDAVAGRLVHSLTGHRHHVMCLAFLADRVRLASGAWNGEVRIWDTVAGRCLVTLTGHANAVRCVRTMVVTDAARSGESGQRELVLSGSSDRTLRVWSLPTESDGAISPADVGVDVLDGHSGYVLLLEVDGTTAVSASTDSTLRVWRYSSASRSMICAHVLHGHTGQVYCVKLDGRLVASGAHDCTIRLWDSRTGRLLHVLSGHSDLVLCVDFKWKLGRLVSGSNDNTVKIWDLSTGKCEHTLSDHDDKVCSLLYTEESVLAGAHDGALVEWNFAGRVKTPGPGVEEEDAAAAAGALFPEAWLNSLWWIGVSAMIIYIALRRRKR